MRQTTERSRAGGSRTTNKATNKATDKPTNKSTSKSTNKAASNQTRKRTELTEEEAGHYKVAELRERLSQYGVGGTSGLRKNELVSMLVKTAREQEPHGGKAAGTGGSRSTNQRRGPASSRSLRYAQEISSTGEEPEKPGKTLVTTNHEVIQQWAQERGGEPATVGSRRRGRPSVLRFDFPGGGGEGLQHIDWDDWFRTFDERQLNFIYQEQRTDGRQSNFFRLENPNREDA